MISLAGKGQETTLDVQQVPRHGSRQGDILFLNFTPPVSYAREVVEQSNQEASQATEDIQPTREPSSSSLPTEGMSRPMRRSISPQQAETQLRPCSPAKVTKRRKPAERPKVHFSPDDTESGQANERPGPSEEDLYNLLQFRIHQNKKARDTERATFLAKEAELGQMTQAYDRLRTQIQVLQTQDQAHQEELSKYRKALPAWRTKVLKFQDTLRSMKQDQDEMHGKVKTFKEVQKDIEDGQAETRSLIEDVHLCLDKTKKAKRALMESARSEIQELHERIDDYEIDSELRDELIDNERQRSDNIGDDISRLTQVQNQILLTMNKNHDIVSESLESIPRNEYSADSLATATEQTEIKSILQKSLRLLEELKEQPSSLLEEQKQMLNRIEESQELTNKSLEGLPRNDFNVEGLATSSEQDEIKAILKNSIRLLEGIDSKPVLNNEDLQKLDDCVRESADRFVLKSSTDASELTICSLSSQLEHFAGEHGISMSQGIKAVGKLWKQVRSIDTGIKAERVHARTVTDLEETRMTLEEDLRVKAAEFQRLSNTVAVLQNSLEVLREHNGALVEEISSLRAEPKIDPDLPRRLNEAEQSKLVMEAQIFDLETAAEEHTAIVRHYEGELDVFGDQTDTLRAQLEKSEAQVRTLINEKDAILVETTLQNSRTKEELLRAAHADKARLTARYEESLHEIRQQKQSEATRATELESKLQNSLQAVKDGTAKSARLEDQDVASRDERQKLHADNTKLRALLRETEDRVIAFSLILKSQEKSNVEETLRPGITIGTQTYQSPTERCQEQDVEVQTYIRKPEMLASPARRTAEESQELPYSNPDSRRVEFILEDIQEQEVMVDDSQEQEDLLPREIFERSLSFLADDVPRRLTFEQIRGQTSPIGETSEFFSQSPTQQYSRRSNSSARRVHKAPNSEHGHSKVSLEMSTVDVERGEDVGTKRKRTHDTGSDDGPRAGATPDRGNKFAREQKSDPRSILKDTRQASKRTLASGSHQVSGGHTKYKLSRTETRDLGPVIRNLQSPTTGSSKQGSSGKLRKSKRRSSQQGTRFPILEHKLV